MFDDIFNGFAGAVVGAAGTVFAVYLAHKYATKEVLRTPSNRSLPKLASRLVGVFATLEIPSAKRFSVAYGSAYTDGHIDLIVGLEGVARNNKFFSKMDVHVNLTLPGVADAEVVINPLPGWNRVFCDKGATYRLTLVGTENRYAFELRVLSDQRKEAQRK